MSALIYLRRDDPLLELALQLEKIALKDEYFVKRKLYPNVDFYSGIMLRAMGIPRSMFTVLFAVARTVGWMANWFVELAVSIALSRLDQRHLQEGDDS